MNTRVLCVDDDPRVLTAYQRNLGDQFAIETAASGAQALQTLERTGPFAVVVADMQMPNMNGIEVLTRVHQMAPETVRIMLTGNADQKTAVEAVNKGQVYRFLNKPCPPDFLGLALDAAVKHYHALVAERELLETTLNGSVQVLIDVLSMTDPHAFATGQKLRDLVRTIGQSLQIEHIWELELAAMLSRIGCVTLPHSVLQKVRSGFALNGPEKEMVQRIPEIGARLIRNVPRLEAASRIVLYQEKHFDGSGFPGDGVAREAIPLGARILKALADLLQLEAHGATRRKALEKMRGRDGIYDPEILRALDILETQPPEQSAAAQQKRAIRLNALKVGDVLAEQVESTDGLVIAGADFEVTQAALEKLTNFSLLSGIKEPIYIVA